MAGTFQNRWRGAAAEADAIGEQQTKRTPSGSRVEADAIGGAAAEADAIGEQQTKRTPSGSRVEADAIGGAAAEADTIGKQLKSRAAAELEWTQAARSS